MFTRRLVMLGCFAVISRAALGHQKEPFVLEPRYEPQVVNFPTEHPVGTVVVDVQSRFLYLLQEGGTAFRYGVGVGRAGLAWSGTSRIGRKAEWPSWTPTRKMIEREPEKYAKYADGVPGGPNNPLGARALYLYHNGHDTLYRIHGTNEPRTIGKAVSNGCIRMLNKHVSDLYERVSIGTRVIVLNESDAVPL